MVLTCVTINNFNNFVLDSNTRSDVFAFLDRKGWHSGMYGVGTYASMFNDGGSG